MLGIFAKLGYLIFALIEDVLVMLGVKAGFSPFLIIGLIVTVFLLWVFVPPFKKLVLMYWWYGFMLLLVLVSVVLLTRI